MNETWFFTFGVGHLLAGHFIRLEGSWHETRQRILEQFGTKWSNQYSPEEWFKDGKSQAEKWGYSEIEIKNA